MSEFNVVNSLLKCLDMPTEAGLPDAWKQFSLDATDDLRVPVGYEPRLAGLSNGAMADPVLTLVSTESRTVIR